VLLGDLNNTLPEALATHEIVWQDIGRHRPRGRTEYSNEALRALWLPGGLAWKVAHRRPTRHGPIQLDPALMSALMNRYGHLHDNQTAVFTPEEWRQANIRALRTI
jgi:hypothetical protein